MRSVIPLMPSDLTVLESPTEHAYAPSQLPQSKLRGGVRVFFFLMMILFALPFVIFFWAVRMDRTRARAVRLFDVCICKVVGIKIKVFGAIDKERPLMLVANHAGYLDVFAIGSLAPVSFTPKREVRSWPFIGFLCVLADCVFVERRPAHMQEARKNMRKRLNKDKILCLFPEGTTSDNTNIIPFKSGFFSLAETKEGEDPLPVQAATLVYTHIGALPMQQPWRERIAWVGDDTFFDHFWRILKLQSVTLEIHFHPARVLPKGGSRKELSLACEQQIVSKLHEVQKARGIYNS